MLTRELHHLIHAALVLSIGLISPEAEAQSTRQTTVTRSDAGAKISPLLTTIAWRRDTTATGGTYRIRHLSFSDDGTGLDVSVSGTRACLSSVRSRNCIMGPGSENTFTWSASSVRAINASHVGFRLCITYEQRTAVCRDATLRLPSIQPAGPMLLSIGTQRWISALPLNTNAMYELADGIRGRPASTATRTQTPDRSSDNRAAAESAFYDNLYKRERPTVPVDTASCTRCPTSVAQILSSARSVGVPDARLIGQWAVINPGLAGAFTLRADGTMTQQVEGSEAAHMYWYQVRAMSANQTTICIVTQPLVRSSSGTPHPPVANAPFQCADSRLAQDSASRADLFHLGKVILRRAERGS